MLKIFIFILVFFQTSISFHANAQEQKNVMSQKDKDNAQVIARELAMCSGTYSAFSDFANERGLTDTAFHTDEVANGAVVASAYLASAMGVIPNFQNAMSYAESTAKGEKARWEALREVTANEGFITNMSQSLTRCNKLGEFQAELVQEARLFLYSSREALK